MKHKEFKEKFNEHTGYAAAIDLKYGIRIMATDYSKSYDRRIELYFDGAFISSIPLKLIKWIY